MTLPNHITLDSTFRLNFPEGPRSLRCGRCGGSIAFSLPVDVLREFVDSHAQCPPRRRESFCEEECGGVFDGFSVSSDADPGL